MFLGLGSNLGDRDLNLLKAMNLLDEAFGTHPERLSRIISTPAWGFEGPDFLNLCVLYRLPRKGTPVEHATEILHQAKAIERALGRTEEALFDANGKRIYHNRIIDIDILFYGDLRLSTPLLTIPHPQVESRPFVGILLEQTNSLADANRRCKC